jgi:aspartyl-tRNA(Asn)/glutamyl-tRNA(Gln) amidotransferase subunit C
MASALTTEEVARIAHLARLALTDDEIELFSRQLTSILEYADQLRDVNTSGVPPTSHPLALTAVMRDDECRPSLARDAALAGAPDADRSRGLFKVPRVLGA